MLKKVVTVHRVSYRQGQMAGAGDILRALCPKETESRGAGESPQGLHSRSG